LEKLTFYVPSTRRGAHRERRRQFFFVAGTYLKAVDNQSSLTVNYRPVLSSERALQKTKPLSTGNFMAKKNWSQVPDGRLTPRQTGRLIVGRKLTSTSTLSGYGNTQVNILST
jgi:hypothetical protein